MFNFSYPSNKLLFTTTRIVSSSVNGEESIGTGFFFNYNIDENRHLPVIITNKHVIQGASQGVFYLHEAIKVNKQKSPSSTSFPCIIENFSKTWIEIPSDCDLCVFPFEIAIRASEQVNKEIFYIPFGEENIPPNEVLIDLSALEEVKMVGYPIGLWDKANNFPILRSGYTASHPSIDFNGKNEGLVDMACLPGSSGSPILIINQGSYVQGNNVIIGSRAYLLGILYAGPIMTVDGVIKIHNIPTKTIPITQTKIPIHLGFYLKSRILMDIKPQLFNILNL